MQLFVLPHDPPTQDEVEVSEDRIQRGFMGRPGAGHNASVLGRSPSQSRRHSAHKDRSEPDAGLPLSGILGQAEHPVKRHAARFKRQARRWCMEGRRQDGEGAWGALATATS